jgi:predicted DNA-binding transcriptional regulator AlpA
MNPTPHLPDDPRLNRARLLSCRQVGELLSVSKRTVLRMSARGELPPPIRLAGRLPRWRLSDIQSHLDTLARREARSAQSAAAALATHDGVRP